MAQIVLGIGTSHSPLLGSPAEDFPHHAERDRTERTLLDTSGQPSSYDELLFQADPALAGEIAPDVVTRRVELCRTSIDRLAQTIRAADLDALVVIGDDQQEQYRDDNMPAILIYWGETIRNNILQLPPDAPPYWVRARSQFHEPSGPRDYPVASELGLYLIGALLDRNFDVSHATSLRYSHGEGHAFGFVHRRLMPDTVVPIVPVALNTYFPPNQPRPKRCYELGRAIRAAIEAREGDERIGILGSGGLSHFAIDEELDRSLLDACRAKDADALMTMPLAKLNSGNSEIRNWIAVAGAVEHLDTAWQEYVPCYRSPAGTGCAMGFAVWS